MVTERAAECERSEGWVEVLEIGLVVDSLPPDEIAVVNGESVNLVEGLKMMKVGLQHARGERVEQIDIDLSSILKEAAFAHVGQKAEWITVPVRPLITHFFFWGKNVLVVPHGEG